MPRAWFDTEEGQTVSENVAVRWCARCDNSRWACEENHADCPWLGNHACNGGEPGAPCPICNRPDDLSAQKMPEGFEVDAKGEDWD